MKIQIRLNRLVALLFSLFSSYAIANPQTATQVCLDQDVANFRGCAMAFKPEIACPLPKKIYHRDSCILSPGENPITEIMKLTAEDEIPKDLLKKYPLEALARNLVLRSYYRQVSEVTDTTSPVESWSNVEIQLAFDSTLLERILTLGFLNQFQTKTSQGTLDQEKRNLAEKIFNFTWIEKAVSPKEHPIHYLRPKYAFAAVFDSQSGYFDNNRYDQVYGDVFAQFKTEVKRRSTMSADDSLSVIAPWNYDVRMTPIGGPKQTAGKFYYEKNSRYFEAQIYGPLTFADVDFLLIGCYNTDKVDPTLAKIKPLLDAYSPQTRVFSCAKYLAKSGVYVEGDLLYPVDSRRKWPSTPIEQPTAP